MDKRTLGRHAVNAIASYNPYTQFAVRDGTLYLRIAGTLLPEQVAIAKEYKDEIKCYLTTPPGEGRCARGHEIKWEISQYGTWLCACASQDMQPGAISSSQNKVLE